MSEGILVIAKRVLGNFHTRESSTSSDEVIVLRESRKRKIHVRIRNYMDTIIKYSDDDFQSHFRLNRVLVETFLQEMQGFGQIKTTGRPAVQPLEAFLLTLWTLATQKTFREIGDRFNFSPGNTHSIFIRTVMFISNKRNEYIKWPEDNEIDRTVREFNHLRQRSFPNVVGCVDGSHIQIQGCRTDNRKGTYSIILQAICNAKMELIDIYTGWPGSSHDAKVWRNSTIFRKLQNQLLPEHVHLLGDTAYPINIFIMVPFKDNGHLTQQQRKFNATLSSTRVVIEQAFGRLKGIWRRLKYLNIINKKYSKYIVGAACVLHNVCIRGNINYDIQDEDLDQLDERAEEYFMNIRNQGTEKRNRIMQELQ